MKFHYLVGQLPAVGAVSVTAQKGKMHLVNANTLQVEEFIGDQLPQYAILSHRWQEGEASFQEMKHYCQIETWFCKDRPMLRFGSSGFFGIRLD